jgi:hypothetical protein
VSFRLDPRCLGPPGLSINTLCAAQFHQREEWFDLRTHAGDRVRTTEIDNASHTLFPKQPDPVAATIIDSAAHASPCQRSMSNPKHVTARADASTTRRARRTAEPKAT